MKKTLAGICAIYLILCMVACSAITNATDLYSGSYTSIDEDVKGNLTITYDEDNYSIYIELYDLTKIDAIGYVENGTLFYHGLDQYGNEIYGNIEEYGNDYPIRVEFYGDDLFDELEFERK